jgi:hypothetical protein
MKLLQRAEVICNLPPFVAIALASSTKILNCVFVIVSCNIVLRTFVQIDMKLLCKRIYELPKDYEGVYAMTRTGLSVHSEFLCLHIAPGSLPHDAPSDNVRHNIESWWCAKVFGRPNWKGHQGNHLVECAKTS